MNNQISNELKAFMEHTNQTTQARMEQTKRNAWAISEKSEKNQLLLEALRNINKNGGDANSNQSEDDNQLHTPKSEHRPTTPPFLPREEQEEEDGLNEVNNINDIINEYSRIDLELRREIPFKDYCDAWMKSPLNRKRQIHQERGLREEINKVSLPKFDGLERTTTHSWVQMLDTYLSLKPMTEKGAIHFFFLHLRGVAQDWWQHDLQLGT